LRRFVGHGRQFVGQQRRFVGFCWAAEEKSFVGEQRTLVGREMFVGEGDACWSKTEQETSKGQDSPVKDRIKMLFVSVEQQREAKRDRDKAGSQVRAGQSLFCCCLGCFEQDRARERRERKREQHTP